MTPFITAMTGAGAGNTSGIIGTVGTTATAGIVGTAPHENLTQACGSNPGTACQLVWDISHDAAAARLVGSFLAHPLTVALRIAFVVLLALAARWVTHRFIDRVTGRAASSLVPQRLRARAASVLEASPVLFSERRRQRSYALGSILRSIVSVIIFGIAGITILGDLGLNLAPLLASAGVAGVAIGFGAQTVVRDFISGIFMLLEDQYGVGDMIDAGAVTGIVEAVGLRVTRLRDISGVVWHVRNGTIERIGNKSQGWARAVVDVPLGYDQDLGRARKIMKDAATAMWEEPQWRDVVLESPEVWGIQALWSNLQVLRLVAKTTSLSQWEATRELRMRVTTALAEKGVTVGVQDSSGNPIAPDGSSAGSVDGKTAYS